jgi:hypothetical protein
MNNGTPIKRVKTTIASFRIFSGLAIGDFPRVSECLLEAVFAQGAPQIILTGYSRERYALNVEKGGFLAQGDFSSAAVHATGGWDIGYPGFEGLPNDPQTVRAF